MGSQEINEELIQTVLDVARKIDHGESIDLILMYGPRAKGTYSTFSDAEFIAVVNSAENISLKFMFNEIEVDMWAISWQRVEEISTFDFFWVLPVGAFATAKPIYVRNEEIQKKYESYRDKALNPENYKEKLLDLANAKYQTLKEHIGTIALACQNEDLIETRFGLWEIIICSVDILGHLNGKYTVENWGSNLDEVLAFSILPDMYEELLQDSVSEENLPLILAYSIKLVSNIRNLLNSANEGRELRETTQSDLEPWPISYANMIVKASQQKHIFGVAYAIHELQSHMMKEVAKYNSEQEKNSMFKLLGDCLKEYTEQGFPDFHPSLTEQEFNKLTNLSIQFKEKFMEKYGKTGVPWFNTLDEIKQHYGVN